MGEGRRSEFKKDLVLLLAYRFDFSVCNNEFGGHLITFFDQNRVSYLIDYAKKLDLKMRQHLYWLKTNPTPRARKVDFMVALEGAVWFTKGKKSGATFNYRLGQQRNYIKAPVPPKYSKKNGKRVHPTQKPTKVLETWIKYLTNENDIVLDPFCGSGSTLVSARRLNRRFVGIDICKEFCTFAKKRINQIPVRLDSYGMVNCRRRLR